MAVDYLHMNATWYGNSLWNISRGLGPTLRHGGSEFSKIVQAQLFSLKKD